MMLSKNSNYIFIVVKETTETTNGKISPGTIFVSYILVKILKLSSKIELLFLVVWYKNLNSHTNK
jgi:hypothetical protein